MKLTINNMTVNITVQNEGSTRANKKDTMDFLSTLSLYLMEAGDSYERLYRCNSMAKESWTIAKDIHEALEAAGLYDKYNI